MRAAAPFALVLALGCADAPATQPFPITFEASSDPGVPLAGVTLTVAGQVAGVTDEHGTLALSLDGTVGAVVPVDATCPEGHRDALPIPALVLRPTLDLTTGAPAMMRVAVTCPPGVRRGVVIVRATGVGSREGIPVMVDGLEVARTDRSGVAHVAVERPPGATINVTLATSAILPDVLPRDPVMPFTFADEDGLFLFDRALESPPPAPTPHGRGHGHGSRPPPETGGGAPHCLSCGH